ncbi:MAG: hypothetical protein IT168_19395 [Bryobacterales bacterium]|nr:hypothetical protein [Bryobacterales bacterium]
MKTAVSLPDELFQEGEHTARHLRMSRSQLYATALREFLERRRANSITERLNEVYSRTSSEIDEALYRAQLGTLEREECDFSPSTAAS